MSDRKYHLAETQGVRHVDYKFTANQAVTPTGTIGPVVGEGDPAGSYLSLQRGSSGMAGVTGTTGTYVITTKDPFPAIVYKNASVEIAGQAAGTWTIEFGKPHQLSDSTWHIPFTVFNSGTVTDLPVGDGVSVSLRFRNSTVKP